MGLRRDAANPYTIDVALTVCRCDPPHVDYGHGRVLARVVEAAAGYWNVYAAFSATFPAS